MRPDVPMEYQVINLSAIVGWGDGTVDIAAMLNDAAADGWRLHTVLQEPNWPLRAVMVRESDDTEGERSGPEAKVYLVHRMAMGKIFHAGAASDYLEAREIYQALMEARTNHIRKHGQMTPDEAYRILAPDGRTVLSFQWPEADDAD